MNILECLDVGCGWMVISERREGGHVTSVLSLCDPMQEFGLTCLLALPCGESDGVKTQDVTP